MSKIFSLLGYLILLIVVLSNLLDFSISDPMVIVMCVISAVFMCVSIVSKDKKKQ
ncbi:MAG: hypothetical protein IJ172_06155 [Ruminococcus sp.]|nr:hypothetical protein [Ruminococcus sp.]